jgi:hypothetical protein
MVAPLERRERSTIWDDQGKPMRRISCSESFPSATRRK